ncbi:MAG: hypothetical protein QXT26_09005 [Thermoproteota archaeon]
MTIFSDNFDDNVLDLNKWQTIWWWTGIDGAEGHVYERNQRLELEVTSKGSNYGFLGVVSRDKFDLSKGSVSAYVAVLSEPQAARVMILISPTKILSGDIYQTLSDYYRIELDHYYDICRVVKKVAGATTVLFEEMDRPMSNVLKIVIEYGIIKFYEGTRIVASDIYVLPSHECYIYILKRYDSTAGLATYYDWVDDFYCEYAGTAEEKAEAKLEILQTGIMEFMQAHWRELSVLAVIIAIVIAIILGVW